MTEADFIALGVDSATIFYVWSWGFGSVIFFWFLGYCVGVAKQVIRQA